MSNISSLVTSRAMTMYEPCESGLSGSDESGEWLRHAVFTTHFDPIMWEAPTGFGKAVLAARLLVQMMLYQTPPLGPRPSEALIICSSDVLAKHFFTKLISLSHGCESINGYLVLEENMPPSMKDLIRNRIIVTTWARKFKNLKLIFL